MASGKTSKKEKSLLAWHFLPSDMKLAFNDGRRVRDGKTIHHKEANGPIKPCYNGLHASLKILDAVRYAYDRPILCRVRVAGEIEHSNEWGSTSDKLVATKRTVLWHVDATRAMTLLPFAIGHMELELSTARVLSRAELKTARSRARQLRNILGHFFTHVHNCTPGAYEKSWDSDWELIQDIDGDIPQYSVISTVRNTTLDKDIVSATFRKLIGMERRGTILDEVNRIASRLNTISKMANW